MLFFSYNVFIGKKAVTLLTIKLYIMTTMTLNIHDTRILPSLKAVLSAIAGVEIATTAQADADETQYVCSSPAMLDIIRKGDEEIARGGGVAVNVDDLWK